MTSSPKAILLNRRTIIFLFGMMLTQFSISMPMVQIPIYVKELGASISEIGLFFTISMIFPLLVTLLGGWLADSLGRLRVIFIGSLTGVLTFAAYAIAPTWQAALLGPALMAITSSLTIPAYFAYIADITPEASRGRMYGLSQTVYNASAVVAPPIGGLIAQSLGYRFMFSLSSVVFAVAALIFLYLLRSVSTLTIGEREVSLRALRSSLGQMLGMFLAGGVVTWILIVDGVRDIAFKLSYNLMPVYLNEIGGLSKQGIGLLDGIYGFAFLIVLYPAGWLADKTSERVGIVAALIAVISSRLVFAFAGGFGGFALSWALLGIGASLFEPSGSSLITKAVPRHLRGTAFGLFATSLSIFSLPAPLIGSQIWNLFGPIYPFLITVAMGSLTVIPAWFKLVLPRQSKGRPFAHEAATLPTIGQSENATVLIAGLPAGLADSLLTRGREILAAHGGVLDSSGQSRLTACFGISPHRAPPQVSALLATHAALSLAEALGTPRGEQDLPGIKIGIGIATGEVTVSPFTSTRQIDQGVRFGDTVTVLGSLLREAEALQTFSLASGGLLISERTYQSLAPARHQFNFGRSGPVRLPGEVREPLAYEVLGRARPLELGPQSPASG